ncbi:hypothetical protein NCCP602_34660 [Brevibacterium metallidurans]|uniref:Insertion element IS1 protein InsA helix-turn-helix domain-containing protein n=2 Tax=Bacteria TaxID=2 RepID=A0ABN0SSW3_9MICO
MAMNGVGCRATSRIMGTVLNTILRHLKKLGRSRYRALSEHKTQAVSWSHYQFI